MQIELDELDLGKLVSNETLDDDELDELDDP